MSFVKYQLEWDDYINDLSVELWCYRNNHPEDRGGLGKAKHFTNAAQILWPEKMRDGSRGYIWHEWIDRRVKAWCEDEFTTGDSGWQTWWGPSSSGKSMDAALLSLVHWLSAPAETTVIVCSTTKDMLEKRIFGEIIRLHSLYKGKLPGMYFKSKHAILLGDENSKNGIFGIAIQKGSLKEALGNMVGIHNRFNVLIIDEMQATKEAAVEAQDNLSTGEEFKFLGMGNPESRLDPLGRYSEPVGGWESISDQTESWQTKFGKTIFFDGLKSPGVRDPKKYFFLLKQADIDNLKKKRGVDSPAFWSQRRGFVPPEGLVQSVLTESFIVKHHMTDSVEWLDSPTTIVGIDPSYASGGDRCVLSPAQVGRFKNGLYGIHFLPFIEINIALSKGPVTYYLVGQVKERCNVLGVAADQIACDTTGVQGMFVDVLEREFGKGVLRVNFVGRPSTFSASSDDRRPADDVYKNRVTELWYNMVEFGRNEQIRGLGSDEAKEFCARKLMDKDLNVIWIEPKKQMKMRTGYSPDIADARAVTIAYVRERMGIHPGISFNVNQERENNEFLKDSDVDGHDNLYLTRDV